MPDLEGGGYDFRFQLTDLVLERWHHLLQPLAHKVLPDSLDKNCLIGSDGQGVVLLEILVDDGVRIELSVWRIAYGVGVFDG